MGEQETFRKGSEEIDREDVMDIFADNSERARERLKFSDYLTQGELYKEWKRFDHPLYGEIEIGGYVKMSSRLPHTFMLQDLVHRNASAVIFAASNTPEISMDVFETEKIAKDFYRVRVRLLNSKAMPTMTHHFVQKKVAPQDMLKVSGKDIKVVSGGRLTDVYRNSVSYKKHKPEVQFLTGYPRAD